MINAVAAACRCALETHASLGMAALTNTHEGWILAGTVPALGTAAREGEPP